MSSTAQPTVRKSLPISALLAVAALASGFFVVAIPAPHQPPGGFANAAQPTNPGVDPDALPNVAHVATAVRHGLGEVASAVVSHTHR